MKHLPSMINGRESIRIFVPLCGKCVDMKWFVVLHITFSVNRWWQQR